MEEKALHVFSSHSEKEQLGCFKNLIIANEDLHGDSQVQLK